MYEIRKAGGRGTVVVLIAVPMICSTMLTECHDISATFIVVLLQHMGKCGLSCVALASHTCTYFLKAN